MRGLTATIEPPSCQTRSKSGELRRRELTGQLERLRDLYVMNDLSKNEYLLRRQAIEEELERVGPPFDPELDEAEELLANFADFWETEPAPAERRRVLATLSLPNGRPFALRDDAQRPARHSPKTTTAGAAGGGSTTPGDGCAAAPRSASGAKRPPNSSRQGSSS